MVKMPPIDGSMCKTEVAEVDKCMMPECRESKTDTFISPSDRFMCAGALNLCLCVFRHHPLHAVALVGVERVQRDVRAWRPEPSTDAEVRSCRLHGGAGANGEVHAARVP